MDYYHNYYICFAETSREEVFKTGQPEDEELRSLAHDIVSFWRTPCFVLRRTTQTSAEINRFHPNELDKLNDGLRESWMASYQRLAESLNASLGKTPDLVKRYCHDKGK